MGWSDISRFLPDDCDQAHLVSDLRIKLRQSEKEMAELTIDGRKVNGVIDRLLRTKRANSVNDRPFDKNEDRGFCATYSHDVGFGDFPALNQAQWH
jgi:hypothetical protein